MKTRITRKNKLTQCKYEKNCINENLRMQKNIKKFANLSVAKSNNNGFFEKRVFVMAKKMAKKTSDNPKSREFFTKKCRETFCNPGCKNVDIPHQLPILSIYNRLVGDAKMNNENKSFHSMHPEYINKIKKEGALSACGRYNPSNNFNFEE